MNTSNGSSSGGVCHNYCQLGRDLVSGGLLAGGIFWVLATVVLIAAEVTGVNTGETPVASPFLQVLGILSAMLESVVGAMPGYRVALTLIGFAMILQSRLLSAYQPRPVGLFVTGLAGVGLQAYNAYGGVVLVSGLFALLILAGLILSVIWIRGESRDQVPVYVDANGQRFARVTTPEMASPGGSDASEQRASNSGPIGLFSAARENSRSERDTKSDAGPVIDIIDRVGEEPLTPPEPVHIEEEHIELPPLPSIEEAREQALGHNVTPFPARKAAKSVADPEPPRHPMETTQEIEQPPVIQGDPFAEEDSDEQAEKVEHELEKTVVIERPAFLDEK
ncbi:MAG TPA: hypothetical protein ENK26_10225 [Gammaproteobacteria bacterium]|nr:hypothetical protein [Gammaproteobacteria bacterium]